MTSEREKEIRTNDSSEIKFNDPDAIKDLLAEIDRLRNAECICPACATEWSLDQPMRLHAEYREKLAQTELACQDWDKHNSRLIRERDQLSEKLTVAVRYFELIEIEHNMHVPLQYSPAEYHKILAREALATIEGEK